MKTRFQTLAIVLIAASSAIGGALAQTADPGIDLEAIRTRAASNAAEADALAASARERAKAVTAEASQNAEGARANGRSYVGEPRRRAASNADTTFDFDLMVADAGDMAKQGLGEAPRFIAFASLSMPPDALRQMIGDVSRAGGVVVFRGLTRGSAKVMTEALGKVLGPGETVGGAGIDPRLFRAFAVTEVPAYVVTASDFELCSGFDCTTAVPPYDRMSGNVTARFALETFSQGGGPGARIAAQHLARFEGTGP